MYHCNITDLLMTKTKYWLSILAISVVLIAGSLAMTPIAIADDDDDDDDDDNILSGTPFSFSWNPNDSSSDPNNLIIVNGAFARQGLLSDTTTDVSGGMEGKLSVKTDNESTTNVTTNVGTATITTSVSAHSHLASALEGSVSIDGEQFFLNMKAAPVVTILEVDEEFTSPTENRALTQTKLTIPVKIEMINADHTKVFEGFGVVRQETSRTESGGNAITFTTTVLEAELIGDTGLFSLTLSKLQRIVEVIHP